MPTQYEKLRNTLQKYSQYGQQINTSQIRSWYAQDWGDEETIFPAQHAVEPQALKLALAGQQPPLLEKSHDALGQAIRGYYRVLARPDMPEQPPPQQAYDILRQALQPYQGQEFKLAALRQLVTDYLNQHHLEKPGLLQNLHRYTPEGYPSCRGGQHLLVSLSRGRYRIHIPQESPTLATDLRQALQQLYQHHGIQLFAPEHFRQQLMQWAPSLLQTYPGEIEALEQLCNQALYLPSLLANQAFSHEGLEVTALFKQLQHQLEISPPQLETGLTLLRATVAPAYAVQSLLNRYFNPAEPDFARHWQELDQWYNTVQADKREIEDFFNQEVPHRFREIDPQELFLKALEWFFSGTKDNQPHLSATWERRQQRLVEWKSPGVSFWEQMPVYKAPYLASWATQALHLLLEVPGLDEHPDDAYPSVYLVSGILASLYPELAFTVSPPSFEGLRHLEQRHLGISLAGIPTERTALLQWIAQLMEQVYELVACFKRLRPDAAVFLSPRRLDMLMYLIRENLNINHQSEKHQSLF